jgi:hypothetical protein
LLQPSEELKAAGSAVEFYNIDDVQGEFDSQPFRVFTEDLCSAGEAAGFARKSALY